MSVAEAYIVLNVDETADDETVRVAYEVAVSDDEEEVLFVLSHSYIDVYASPWIVQEMCPDYVAH